MGLVGKMTNVRTVYSFLYEDEEHELEYRTVVVPRVGEHIVLVVEGDWLDDPSSEYAISGRILHISWEVNYRMVGQTENPIFASLLIDENTVLVEKIRK